MKPPERVFQRPASCMQIHPELVYHDSTLQLHLIWTDVFCVVITFLSTMSKPPNSFRFFRLFLLNAKSNLEVCPTRYLLLADSRARPFEFRSLNTLSQLGASARQVDDLIPHGSMFDKIILICGNDFIQGCDPSSANPKDVARDIVELAKYPVHRTREVFVLGTPERNENNLRARTSKDIFEAQGKRVPRRNPMCCGSTEA